MAVSADGEPVGQSALSAQHVDFLFLLDGVWLRFHFTPS